MSKITEAITTDGEVFSLTESSSEKEFEFKILNYLDFETVKSFFIKKSIIEAVKAKHKLSNGSNGVTTVELLNLFRWNDIELYLKELEEKKIITKRQGLSLQMYFMYKK